MSLLADLLGLAVIGAYAARGYWAGCLASFLRLLGMVWAAFALWLFWGMAVRGLHALFHMPALVAFPLAGVVVLLPATVAFSVIVWLVRRRAKGKAPQPAQPPERTRADKIGGAVIGACGGIVMMAALVFAYGMARMAPFGAGWPDIHDSAAGRIAAPVIWSAAYLYARSATNNPQVARAVANSAVNPRGAADDARRIARNPDVAALARDPQFTDAVLRSDVSAIKADARLQRLTQDPEFIRSARRLGILRPQSGSSNAEEETAELLARIGRNAARIRNDPEARSVLEDPAIQALAAEKDYRKLLQDERVMKLAGRVMQLLNSDAPRGAAADERGI